MSYDPICHARQEVLLRCSEEPKVIAFKESSMSASRGTRMHTVPLKILHSWLICITTLHLPEVKAEKELGRIGFGASSCRQPAEGPWPKSQSTT